MCMNMKSLGEKKNIVAKNCTKEYDFNYANKKMVKG